ncbi:MAG: copper chaperone Copz family protein, partial [Acidobacteria bacterium]|nr:copper chaperone Copz family protein [Acidobacteriota bacterium]
SERQCPLCGMAGATVELQTVKALLMETALARLQLTHHRFCGEPGCDVVYFDDAGGTFVATDIRVPVWQKQPAGARMICYCFAESESTIRDEMARVGASRAVQRVRAHIEARRCACDVRNPRGACCLGDVIAAVRRAETPGRAGEDESCQSATESAKSRA